LIEIKRSLLNFELMSDFVHWYYFNVSCLFFS